MDDVRALHDRMMALYYEHKEAGVDMNTLTVWDLFLELIPTQDLRVSAVMKADLPILELIARGKSAGDASKFLGVSVASVKSVCDVWNIKAPLKTLDVDPLLVYNDGVSFREFKETFLEDTLHDYDDWTLRNAMDAIAVYKGLLAFLEDVDK